MNGPLALFSIQKTTLSILWLALFFIQQTDLTSFSEDGRGVKWPCKSNPTPTLTPNRNPNSRINKKIQKETTLENR
jgi:hypothetical protein